MEVIQKVIHYFLHFIFPLGIAFVFYRERWERTYLILLVTMVIDFDHLLAVPVYNPCRCSIGFHPLHQLGFILLYCALCIAPKTRLFGLGLCIHMGLDALDCQATSGIWIHEDI